MEHRSKIVGVKQTLKAIRQGRATIVYLAEDADSFVSIPVIDTCKEHGVRLEYISSKSELGRMCHVDVPSAVAADVVSAE